MARILLAILVLLVLGAGGGFVWFGLFPPSAPQVQVTHQIPVGQLAGS